jgi:hypothetical protein
MAALPQSGRYSDQPEFESEFASKNHLLDFRFALRIRDLGETRLFSVAKLRTYPVLEKLVGDTVATKQINAHWKISCDTTKEFLCRNNRAIREPDAPNSVEKKTPMSIAVKS